MRTIPIALAALLSAPMLRAEVVVAVGSGRVDLTATSAPLADVLERLGLRTGMTVSYDGPPPRQAVSAALHQATPAEAVLSLLEGLGLSYAIQLGPRGTRVKSLLLVTDRTDLPPPGRVPPQRRPRPVRQRPPVPVRLPNRPNQEAQKPPVAPSPRLPPPPVYPSSPFTPKLPTPFGIQPAPRATPTPAPR